MKIVCAASVYQAREAFAGLGEVCLRPDRDIRREHLREARALIVRSKTRVGPELLADTPVEFVATATAGSDHLDLPWLEEAGIAWSAAAGCNANAVAEYAITALTWLALRHGALLAGKTLGLVGLGQVGSRVAEKAPLLGLRVLRNDPPLALQTGAPEYLPLEAVLAAADILSLHVPLTAAGPFPTRHLADCRLFGRLKPGAWFLNTARGEVADSDSLLYALERHSLGAAGLDVWEGEPAGAAALARAVDFLTPHIAGYSLEGLLNGTRQCHRELCHFLEVEPTWTPDPRTLPAPPFFAVSAAHRSDEDVLAELLQSACPIPADHHAWQAEMTAAPDPGDLRRRFDRFRQGHTSRREFSACRVHLTGASPALLETVAALGFQVCTHQP